MPPRLTLALLQIVFTTLPLTAAVVLEPDAVMDQIGDASLYDLSTAGTPNASQFFTDFAGFDSMAIDDFTVAPDQLRILSVTGLFRAAGGTGRFATVDGYQVSIFSNPASAGSDLNGDIASVFVAANSASVDLLSDGSTGLVSLGVDLTLPSEGTYWVGIAPVSALGVTGQFYVHHDGAAMPLLGNANGAFANPGGGFGVGGLTNTTFDYAYRVSTGVPEPSILCTLTLTGLALLNRRRRIVRPARPRHS